MGARSVFAVGDIKQSIFSFKAPIRPVLPPCGAICQRRRRRWWAVGRCSNERFLPFGAGDFGGGGRGVADPEMAAAVGEEVPIRQSRRAHRCPDRSSYGRR